MKNMQAFFVQPDGPIYFGEPRSNSAGESHLMRGRFPMPQSAFQGMIRTRLLHCAEPALDLRGAGGRTAGDAQAEIAALVGQPDQLPRGWQFCGPFPAVRRRQDSELTPWLPIPACLGPVKSTELSSALKVGELIDDSDPGRDPSSTQGNPRYLGGAFPSKTEQQPPATEEARLHFGWRGAGKVKAASGWMSADAMEFFLRNPEAGRRLDLHAEQAYVTGSYPPFVEDQYRTGGALQDGAGQSARDSGRARPQKGMADGMLYTYQEHRYLDVDKRTGNMQQAGMVGWYRLEDLSPRLSAASLQHGHAKLGRRARPAALSPVERWCEAWQRIIHADHLQASESHTNEAFVWLVLLTPLVGEVDGLQANLQARAAAGTTISIASSSTQRMTLGGYSLAENQNRPNLAAWAPGSAWLLHISSPDELSQLETLRSLHNQHLDAAERAPFGYGHVFCSRPFTSSSSPSPTHLGSETRGQKQ
jgi:hypothetical protein